MTRSVHTGTQTVDVTVADTVEGSDLTKRKQDHVALRTTENAAVTGDPEITLEASVDGETWITVDSATGTEISLEADVPEQYVRASVTTAADAGSLTLWLAAL